ncbi:WD40/YVTN/BNR-like repeat-containing protein [Rhodoflexus caldus]|uniref:WD40/YVTN/BNR-like repeat-containing protein n=1 Tax=Rhodoflexus caldus TaxID=2891236 RepID=UPI002029D381|nr:glycosyl hydrolase [Rhodoflexus caldus]
MKTLHYYLRLLMLLLIAGGSLNVWAQRSNRSAEAATTAAGYSLPEKFVYWRSIGPFRGGRSCAVTGVNGQPNLFYMGATGGGVWKTTDGGNSWTNISDGFFGGSIGAIAVAESDPNVIYVGGGEKTVRGNVSHGYGMWKSMDAGKTWQSIGLEDSRHIGRIRVHPKNPDLVYVAVMGHLFGPHEQRGVYRSKDGGKTWERILFANNQAGAVDLILDPNNPRVIYASTWRVIRTPYSLESGGEGSALWKSTDGGDTWKNISGSKGLPKGTLGIIGVTVSPKNSNRVWALIEAADGGVFRSDDGGETWMKTNEDRALRQRAWYYTRIYADTQNEDMVYVLNVSYHRSKDGGRTFQSFNAPHGDHHDLWISSVNNQSMIIGDDGGAQVSQDGGTNWTTYHNQPTAQFYRVVTDNHFPYRIYVAQQDNSTLRIAHRSFGNGGITEKDWEETAGGESGHIAVNPQNNDIVFGGSYGGFLERLDHSTGESRNVNVYPENPMGSGAEGMKYRFQWNFPIFYSPHDPNTLYAAGNHLFKTTNEGQSWQMISPDLTRNVADRMKASGGPITKDNTGVEYYCTIFAACESPYEKDLLWAGSDDGLIHLSRDGGKNWENVTPPASIMPEWMMINSIEPHPFVKGGAYVAGTRYKMDDFQPYLFVTTDYGKTWKKITNGIKKDHFTRVLRADPVRKGLLFAGTESGIYISFDDGANWQSLQFNLPIVPITDLTIKDGDLIAATQGRSLWLIDDLTPLRNWQPATAQKSFELYQPRPAYRVGGGNGGRDPKLHGENLNSGVMVQFFLKNAPDSANVVTLEFMDKDQKLIKRYASNAKERREQLEAQAGGNRFFWNMRYPDAEGFDGLILWGGGLQGPLAVPGNYFVKLKVGKDSAVQAFEIRKDPRSKATQEDLQAQFTFLTEVRDKLTETHKAIKNIRAMREQLNAYTKRLDRTKDKDLLDQIGRTQKQMTEIEEALYQTKNRSGQDPLNFPIRLNNKLSDLAGVVGSGNFRPTDQAITVKNDITAKIDAELAKLKAIFSNELPKLNEAIKAKNLDAIVLP